MTELQLETARLRLRLMRPSDIDDLLKIFADPKVMASFGVDIFNREQMEHWMLRNLEHQDQHGYGLFPVILKSESVLIGNCGLELMDLEGEAAAELGYDFRSDYWNRGFATEAAFAVRDYAFQELQLQQLISLIRTGNEASRRVSEKIGMHFEEDLILNGISYWKYTAERP